MKQIQLSIEDEYDLDFTIKFDFPIAFFGSGLLSKEKDQNNKLVYEDVDD